MHLEELLVTEDINHARIMSTIYSEYLYPKYILEQGEIHTHTHTLEQSNKNKWFT